MNSIKWKLTICIVFILKLHCSAQWVTPIKSPISNLTHLSDTGFVISGSTSQGSNVIRLDKNGNILWDKRIVSANPNISLEVNDGYIGGDVYNKNLLKIDKNGIVIYNKNTIYTQPTSPFKNTILLASDDSLARFNHNAQVFLWKKNTGSVKDTRYLSNKYLYEILHVIDNNFYKTILDTNGNKISTQLIKSSVKVDKNTYIKFYLSGFLSFQPIDYNRNYLSYVKINGDTVWKKASTSWIGEGLAFSVDSSSVLMSNYGRNQSDLYRFDSTGKETWRHIINEEMGSGIVRTLDEGIALTCTTSYAEMERGFWKKIIKLAPEGTITSNNVALEKGNLNVQFVEANNELHFIFPRTVNTNETFMFYLYDLSGRLIHNQFVYSKQPTISCPNFSGIYFYRMSNEATIFSGKLSIK